MFTFYRAKLNKSTLESDFIIYVFVTLISFLWTGKLTILQIIQDTNLLTPRYPQYW